MIRKFLDCSSGHLSPATWVWLDVQLAHEVLRDPTNTTAARIAGGRTRYGWFVYATEDPFDGLPDDLAVIFAVTRAAGAEYVLLDCDAPSVDRLPILHPDFREEPHGA